METDCNVIRDEHETECAEELKKLQAGKPENHPVVEKEAARDRQEKKFSRGVTVKPEAGWFMLIPLAIFLFVNRLQGGLSLFFVVAASLAVAASVTVVPVMASENKLFWTFCAFCASLVLLLAVTCIYTGGDWFFVAASASLFGLSVVFLPFVIQAKPIRKYVPENRARAVIAADGLLFAVMMACIWLHNHGLGSWRGLAVTGLVIGLAVYYVIPEMKKRGFVK